jgi:hypothetical protein
MYGYDCSGFTMTVLLRKDHMKLSTDVVETVECIDTVGGYGDVGGRRRIAGR